MSKAARRLRGDSKRTRTKSVNKPDPVLQVMAPFDELRRKWDMTPKTDRDRKDQDAASEAMLAREALAVLSKPTTLDGLAALLVIARGMNQWDAMFEDTDQGLRLLPNDHALNTDGKRLHLAMTSAIDFLCGRLGARVPEAIAGHYAMPDEQEAWAGSKQHAGA